MFSLAPWSYHIPPPPNVLHLVSARVLKEWGAREPDMIYFNEDATMLSFGEKRFLVCHMNRLWSVSKDPRDRGDDYSDGHKMYPNAWHWACSKHEIEFMYKTGTLIRVGEAWIFKEERLEDVKKLYVQIVYDSDVVAFQFRRYGMRRAFAPYLGIDITDKLILLQCCVRKYNACRRRARRLALAKCIPVKTSEKK